MLITFKKRKQKEAKQKQKNEDNKKQNEKKHMHLTCDARPVFVRNAACLNPTPSQMCLSSSRLAAESAAFPGI